MRKLTDVRSVRPENITVRESGKRQFKGDEMPANFDDMLTIDEYGHVSPRGPLTLGEGETLTEVYAWVAQVNGDDTGAFCTAEGGPGDVTTGPKGELSWATKADAKHVSHFRHGDADATGFLVTTGKGGNKREYWWKEKITVSNRAAAAA